MLVNMGELCVKCMRKEQKAICNIYGVSYYVLYRHRAQSVLWNAGKGHKLVNWSP